MNAYKEDVGRGLKGFALCFIVLYIAADKIFTGAHLGYHFLFALFGFLSVETYIKEKIYAGPYFAEKIRRLWPPLLAMVCVSTCLYAIFFFQDLPLIRGQALSALFFGNNFFQSIEGHPLSIHQPSPLGHLWFLSLLVQFYLVFTFCITGKKTKQKIISLCLLLGLISGVSVLLMGIYGGLGFSATRIFYMPDSRLFSFFLSALFVLYATMGKGRAAEGNRDIALLGILILFVISVFFMPEGTPAYFGGLLCATLLFNLFFLFLFRDGESFFSIFTFPLFSFLGERVYEIYLYSMPSFFFTGRLVRALGGSETLQTLLAFPVLLIAAQASHYFFEKREIASRRVLAAFAVPLIMLLAVSYATQEEKPMLPIYHREKVVKTVEADKKDTTENRSVTERFQPSNELAAAIEQINAQKPAYKLTNDDLFILQDKKAYVWGNSAIEGLREAYAKIMPSISLEAGKHLTIPEIAKRVKDIDKDTPLVLQVGNDGPVSYAEVKEIVDAAEGRAIFLFTVVADPAYEDKNNDVFNRIASDYANVALIDWYGEAKTQGDFFDEDGNMKQPAKRLMAQMLAYSLLHKAPPATQATDAAEGANATQTNENSEQTE